MFHLLQRERERKRPTDGQKGRQADGWRQTIRLVDKQPDGWTGRKNREGDRLKNDIS